MALISVPCPPPTSTSLRALPKSYACTTAATTPCPNAGHRVVEDFAFAWIGSEVLKELDAHASLEGGLPGLHAVHGLGKHRPPDRQADHSYPRAQRTWSPVRSSSLSGVWANRPRLDLRENAESVQQPK